MKHCHAVIALVCLLLAPTISRAQTAVSTEISELAIQQFNSFGQALGVDPADAPPPRVELYGTFVVVQAHAWVYTMDASGIQTFRPASTSPILGTTMAGGKPGSEFVLRPDQTSVHSLTQSARNLAVQLNLNDNSFDKVVVKKELLIGGAVKDQPLVRPGRYLVRFCGNGYPYFQVLTNQSGKALRVDTNVQTDGSMCLSRLLLNGLQKANALPEYPGDPSWLTLATFFNPSEYRFESAACRLEGETFLDARVTKNPYQPNDFSNAPLDLRINGVFDASKRTDLVDFAAWRQSNDYRYWCWRFWDQYGRLAGIRGNWDSLSRMWQRKNVKVEHFNLKNYALAGGEPTEMNDNVVLSDGRKHSFPHASSRQLVSAYFDDLEHCSIAVFLTHGGPSEEFRPQRRFQLQRSQDVWFLPSSKERPLGTGALRHALFLSCGTIDSFKAGEAGEKYLSLYREWLNARYVNGLRTACGCDGGMDTSDTTGTRFFEKYNKGDSISDSWLLGIVNESLSNMPATVAYGATLKEALTTLADGRFSTEKTVPTYSVASVWTAVEEGPTRGRVETRRSGLH